MSYSTPRPLSYLIDAISELERRIQRLEAALQCEGRIATECARVSPIEEHQVRRVITARRIRNQHLGSDLVADPAWDLLLGAFAASRSVPNDHGASQYRVTLDQKTRSGWMGAAPAFVG